MTKRRVPDEFLVEVFCRRWQETKDLAESVKCVRVALELGATKDLLRDNMRRRRVPHGAAVDEVRPVLECVAAAFGIPNWEALVSGNRVRAVARARMRAAWVLVRVLGFSTPRAGRALGGRDHTTILHALHRVEAEISARPELEGQLRALAVPPEIQEAA